MKGQGNKLDLRFHALLAIALGLLLDFETD